VIYQEIDDATNAASAGVPSSPHHSANPDIKLVVTDHGKLTGTVQTFLKPLDSAQMTPMPLA
jgi:simple sugar transport system substrate-binding protein